MQIEPPAPDTASTTSRIGDVGTHMNEHGFQFAVKDVAIVQVFQVIVACFLTGLTLRFESSFVESMAMAMAMA